MTGLQISFEVFSERQDSVFRVRRKHIAKLPDGGFSNF